MKANSNWNIAPNELVCLLHWLKSSHGKICRDWFLEIINWGKSLQSKQSFLIQTTASYLNNTQATLSKTIRYVLPNCHFTTFLRFDKLIKWEIVHYVGSRKLSKLQISTLSDTHQNGSGKYYSLFWVQSWTFLIE